MTPFKNIILLFLTCVTVGLQAQVSSKKFSLPSNAFYASGRVLVKIKSEYKGSFEGSAGARTMGLPVLSMTPMVKPALAKKGAAMRGPLSVKPVVDIALYYDVVYDRSRNIEEYINELYSTGLFEIVEPAYAATTTYTPNDPAISKQYYLNRIKAIEAWSITKGSPDITIAIVDSGGDLDHPDLAGNLYTNPREIANNGIDDDGDGYIDNTRGWDFLGADTANVFNPNFKGDNDPSIKQGGLISHGTWVAGCASAVADNGIGIAGVGFNTKLMFTKHTADNQKTTNGTIYFGYSGILYAANQGIKIINCSWGGSGSSQIVQDLINHVTLDLGCLVVAAAGNDGTMGKSYPGAYDNVFSVASSESTDVKSVYSQYGPTVDISTPGSAIYTTSYDNGYATVSGTSFSSPITAGAAALVWAKNPGFTALQVAEQLRVTSDAKALYDANGGPTSSFYNMLGKGRLDVYAALSVVSPAIHISNPKFVDATGNSVDGNEEGFLTMDFTNYLQPSSAGLTATITVSGDFTTIEKKTISIGILNTNERYNNSLNPFKIKINGAVGTNTILNVTVTLSDGAYTDMQLIGLLINPSFINSDVNQINTTITSIGRIGYEDQLPSPVRGSGFIFNQQQLVSEIGLMMGNSSGLLDNVRADLVSGVLKYDQSFTAKDMIKKEMPGARADEEISGSFEDQRNPRTVHVDYRSLAWKTAPFDQMVIMEYKITNLGLAPAVASNFYFAMFADWDIGNGGANDAAEFAQPQRLGYVHPLDGPPSPYAGIQLLTGTPNYFAIDNDGSTPGTPFGIYDGFSVAEKIKALTTSRLEAGKAVGAGGDVSHVVTAGPYIIPDNGSITIAFALHAANNLSDLKRSANKADTLYNLTLTTPTPVVNAVLTCYGSSATLHASGATAFKWYTSATGGNPVYSGNDLVIPSVTSDTTLFVSNAENLWESVRTPAVVKVKANPTITTSASTTFCTGHSIILSVADADAYLWSNGETTKTITVSTAGSFSVKVKDNALGCESTSATITTTVLQSPVSGFSYTGALQTGKPVTFTDESVNAASVAWNFGDGTGSTERNPVHTFTSMKVDTVSQTAFASNGCQTTSTKVLSVVTGLDDSGVSLNVYPNPASDGFFNLEMTTDRAYSIGISVTDLMGRNVHSDDFTVQSGKNVRLIKLRDHSPGVYILKVKSGSSVQLRKIILVD